MSPTEKFYKKISIALSTKKNIPKILKFKSENSSDEVTEYHLGANSGNISIEEFLKDYHSFLTGGFDKKILLKGKLPLRKENIINYLVSENIQGDLFEKIFISILKENFEGLYRHTLLKLVNKTHNPDYEKKIIFRIIDELSTDLRDIDSFKVFVNTFLSLDIKKEDYKLIKKYFDHNTEILNLDYLKLDIQVIKLLKEKIPVDDWHEFASYCPNDNGLKFLINKDGVENLFEDDLNPTFNLIIKENYIRKKYPVLSSSKDMKKLINLVIENCNKYAVELGIKNSYISIHDNEGGNVHCHFISNSLDCVDIGRIKRLIEGAIDLYNTVPPKEQDNQVYLDKVFQTSILESKIKVNENIKMSKRNKL